MKPLLVAAAVLAITGYATIAFAQTPAAPPQQPAADTVVLKDGTRIEGRVVEQAPGKFVIIQTAEGQRTLSWDDVKEVIVKTPKKPPPVVVEDEDDDEEVVAPKKKKSEVVTKDAKLNPDGTFSASQTQTCAEDDAACKKQMSVSGSASGLDAKYHAEEDCSDEDDEDCKETTDVKGGTAGVGVSYARESAKAVKGPRSGAANLGLAVGVQGGFGDAASFFGATTDLNVRLMTGGKFPGKTGGSWFGWFFEPGGSLSYGAIKIEQQCFDTGFGRTCAGGDSQSFASVRLGASTGLQMMWFGAMDRKSKKQSGFGLGLGGLVGVFIPISKGGESRPAPIYGPTLNLIFPKYNPGTASYSSFQVNFFLLPTKDFLTFSGGLQWSFG